MAGLQLDLSGVINEAIDAKLNAFNIEEQVKEMLEGVAQKAGRVLTVKLEGGSPEGKKFPIVHKQFETLLKVASIEGVNVLLTGGAGLSKSTAVEQVAEAFNLEMSSISFSNQTTKTDLLGYMDANGIYRESGFIDAFRNGKVFLADEMDACSSNVLVILNDAIARRKITTPDKKLLVAHENFRFVGTANTNLRGAKDGFTARNKLDSATIDRFAVIEWTLDEELEERLTNNDGWLKIVRKCRTVAEQQLDGVVITPRSSYDGAKLLKAGLSADDVIQMTIIKAMGEDEAEILLKGITANMKATAEKHATGKKVEVEKPEVVEPEVPELIEIDDADVEQVKPTKKPFDW